MNVYEEDTYPFLAQETIAIQKALENGMPVIGFCLGAQLMAKAVCLASSQDYPNQAMRVGTKDMIAEWLRSGKEERTITWK
jgi:GMP synthase (glutamine-hydrolysing)